MQTYESCSEQQNVTTHEPHTAEQHRQGDGDYWQNPVGLKELALNYPYKAVFSAPLFSFLFFPFAQGWRGKQLKPEHRQRKFRTHCQTSPSPTLLSRLRGFFSSSRSFGICRCRRSILVGPETFPCLVSAFLFISRRKTRLALLYIHQQQEAHQHFNRI